jgi:regulator of nucleoside diphosphate kinase
MAFVHDLIISRRDAEMLARVLADHRRANPLESGASDALAELLHEARFVADDALPEDRIGLGSSITYAAGTARRTVALVPPALADVAAGRISVLSPIGLALVGRRSRTATEARLPDGRRLELRILKVTGMLEPLAAAA